MEEKQREGESKEIAGIKERKIIVFGM